MLKLIQLVSTLKGLFNDLPISLVLEVLKQLAKIGLPPDIDSKEDLRHWLASLHPVLRDFTEATPTPIDDEALVLLSMAVENDEAWEALHSLLTLASDGRVRADTYAEMNTLADKAGMDIATIMAIVQMVVRIIQMLRS